MHGTVVWARGGSVPGEAALLEALGLTVPGGRIFAVHGDGRVNGRRSAGVAHRHGHDAKRRTP